MNKPGPHHGRKARLRPTLGACLFGSAIALVILPAKTAQAAPFTITTTGLITAGTDPGNILGLGANLTGDSYSLAITYGGPGPNYFTDGSGGFAQDFGDAIASSVIVRVGSSTLSTVIVSNATPSLSEDTSDIIDSTSGNDATGNFVFASQDVGAATTFVPYADLQTPVSYLLGTADSGIDSYSFSNAANTETISFSGVTSQISLKIPEPASLALMGVGFLALVALRRRSHAD
jgi:hypothetical protein